MKLLIVFIPFIIAVLLSRVMIPYILLISYKKRLFDPIDSRKLHKRIVPRLGGVAFAPIQCCLYAITTVAVYKLNFVNLHVATWEIFPMFTMLICGLAILFIVGIGDDLIGVNYKAKFIAQIFVACLFPLSGLWINNLYGVGLIVDLPAWIGMPLTIFVVVLIINAINLMDGLDGLCSGVVGLGCVVLGGLFMYYGAWLHALFAFITAGVLIPFFYYNVFGTVRRRRQIFMGDTGSMTLGYSIAFLAISFAMNNHFIKPFSEGAIVVAFSTLIVPILDVARVMYVRWRSGKSMFSADRNHLHHKFLRSGMTHRTAMLAILGLALFFCIFNIVMVELISNNVVVVCDVLLWILFHSIFNRVFEKKIKEYKHLEAVNLSEN
ncbi:undecaprenyl/decaprenyl-phosphate alpha-N-acetylglucosaminyl 1-phosphate transferase [Elizabethkingia meningoseptica]|uniref:Undecaprenyl-phosphate alpha-N-acetylglucosaminyl 1-phosphate transferase n=1 Tax=Elizabethkingia meningoseptica TaxID=238 RepID=A0A1T3FHI8_ELIME|nr:MULTISPECIES: MraY family glycosyltransferase [Elizabethkingia]AQX12402.1 undecaprenyl-phosphate alpha-N-acetylglucosaminyl 1-phosphate transferase [Elizabethkingia meningoseptica]EJK5329557.1 undecaprenyl/decaprenyl-phosphate alpha-N-acetylglucosaminyl 1-phosphate transferase [Elizabethkingia meningoseptica]MBG0513937.1 undecaprenyl/decaprenyl-phosphate alpha-N-acetylglucosaminyl 1-phosphate transferase [Elizabethkingia meningoseptica]MDE5432853.1 undecaprenyl/decaprenyl-phosphate alpha-N-a